MNMERNEKSGIGYLIDMRGAIDLHFHPAPCLFPRLATDRQVSQAAERMGMRGLVFKCHHESTVSRARMMQQEHPSLRIFGGIVLNSYVGGINPKAVEAAITLGTKEVWLPTIDAAYHAKLHSGTGRYDAQESESARTNDTGISVVQDGQITQETRAVFEMVAEHDLILGTCHQSYDELRIIVRSARDIGIKKILLTHPFFRAPGLTLEQIREFVDLGAIAEFGYCTVSPMWAYANIPQVASAIRALGPDRCVLISDTGQRHNPMPPEALRVFAQSLFEAGITEPEIDIMIKRNPALLLGLDPDAGPPSPPAAN